MPSIWPETFSYVAHEIKSMGLPMVTFNLGAQADLAKSYEKGYVIDLGDPEEIINQLTVFHQTLKKI
jgi:glycosyltransferase involved in cell wall biosynthesis